MLVYLLDIGFRQDSRRILNLDWELYFDFL